MLLGAGLLNIIVRIYDKTPHPKTHDRLLGAINHTVNRAHPAVLGLKENKVVIDELDRVGKLTLCHSRAETIIKRLARDLLGQLGNVHMGRVLKRAHRKLPRLALG